MIFSKEALGRFFLSMQGAGKLCFFRFVRLQMGLPEHIQNVCLRGGFLGRTFVSPGGNIEEASGYNTKAQGMFSEESDMSGEADALKMNAEIQWKKNEFPCLE